MIVVRSDDPQKYHSPGQTARQAKVFIDEEKIGRKDVVMGMSTYGAGTEAPFHTHSGSETMFVVRGNGQFGTKERVIEAGPGDVLYFPPGEEHFLKNSGSQKLEFVWVYSQPGDEKPIKDKWVRVPT
jgi:quercetin dioxygenase-like cupin family protein